MINSAGLVLDIVGAFLVAWEVVREYRGKKYRETQGYVISEPFVTGIDVKEAPEYAACLTLGFLLQILSNWVR